MKNLVITAGETFADIDVLACAIAYSELMTLSSIKNEVVLPGVLNSSITPTIRSWDFKYNKKPSTLEFDVAAVDVSEFKYFAKFVKLEQVVKVFDHRFGFQDFWKEKLGENSRIEFVGSCATLIWEEFKKAGFTDKISKISANLLYTSILSNTLNFKSSVTDQRDIVALEELKKYTDLPENWAEKYFSEVQESVSAGIKEAIGADTKTFDLENIGFPIVMAQLELWDANKFFAENKEQLDAVLKEFYNSEFFLSIPSISENKNYIYTNSAKIKTLLLEIIKITFDGDLGVTDKLWLRKEIRKKLIQKGSIK